MPQDNKEETILRYRNASSLSLDTITSGISAISDIFTDATPPNRRRFGSHADLSDLIPALRQDQVEHEMKADPWAPEHPEQAKEATVKEELAHERFLEMIKSLKTCGFEAEMAKCRVFTRPHAHLHEWGHWQEFDRETGV